MEFIKKIIGILLFGIVLSMYAIEVNGQEKKEKSEADKIIESLHPNPKKSKDKYVAGIKLLPGYKATHETDFEANEYGEIKKRGGLKITYEMGPNEGDAVKTEEKDSYLYYSEKIIKNRIVRCAFTKEKIFIISVPLSDDDSSQAANFKTHVEKPEDASDMLTMALTLLENQ